MTFQFANPLALALLTLIPVLAWLVLRKRAQDQAALQYANVAPARVGRGWKARLRCSSSDSRVRNSLRQKKSSRAKG